MIEAEDVNELHFKFAKAKGLTGEGDELKGKVLWVF